MAASPVQPAVHVLQLEREAALHTFKDSLGGVGMPVNFALPEHVSLHGLCLSLSQEAPSVLRNCVE